MKINKLLAVLLILAMALTVTACGKVAMVSINDDGMKTELEAKLPETVGKILEQAGISLAEGDIVTPAVTEKISESTEIVIGRIHSVKLTANGKTESFSIVGGTVADLLTEGGITLKDKQVVNYELDEPLKEGMEVQVLDQMSVSVTCDGETKTQIINSTLIADVIKEFGITLGEDDEVTPGLDQKATDGMEIVVDRVKYETVTETEAIAYDVETAYDATLARGTEYTSVSGEYGEIERVYSVKYVNGEETETELVEEKITKAPVNAVVVMGPYVVSKVAYPDCNDSSHGYYEIIWSDGGEPTYEDY